MKKEEEDMRKRCMYEESLLVKRGLLHAEHDRQSDDWTACFIRRYFYTCPNATPTHMPLGAGK